MKINANEISTLIKQEIKNYAHRYASDDVGTIMSVGDGIAIIYGLDKAMLNELLLFPNDVYGMVLNLEEGQVGAVLLGSDRHLKEGDVVKRTGQVVEVPVGEEMLGRVVNALGQPIDGLGSIETKKHRPIERIAPGVMQREPVNKPLQTGILAIDSMIPIGRGQRELIIGDRQTGKTAIAIDTIINQKDQNVRCVYVAIGQKNSTVANIVDKLRSVGSLSYTTVVSATASELAPLQWIAPYTGVSIAEEWMEQGKDVLIVYDDLSKHAIAYRTLSLLLKRSPGREAYPGDIFYLHSRLLERACKLNQDFGGGSITALPIIETQAGDISAYIPTNVISITDGQIFLMTDLFNAGQRPAIDSGLSVSRVGAAAQIDAIKQVSRSLKIELASFRELQAFTQFGSDLDAATKKVLTHGASLMEVLRQNQYAPYSVESEVIALFLAKNRYLDPLAKPLIQPRMGEFLNVVQVKYPEILAELKSTKKISKELDERLHSLARDFFSIDEKAK